MENEKRPFGYLGGDIMGFGSNLAREYEYKKFLEAKLPVDVYSPVQNKSINDKANMTEEQNNCLAEKITEADIERLWNSDFTVMEPRQDAIGTLCEVGCLYGWWYMCHKLLDTYKMALMRTDDDHEALAEAMREVTRIALKRNYFHYFDIRTNHLNEKDWRRSFSINQLLYGMILACSQDGKLYNSFDEVLPELERQYGKDISPELLKKIEEMLKDNEEFDI